MPINPPFLDAYKLIEMFAYTKTATAIHVGEEAYIQFANDAMLKIWGKDRSIIGKSLQDALPELKDQPFINMFAKVWNEGLTISGADTPAILTIDGLARTFYFDFEYRAILDELGNTICIIHSATDVTERYLNQKAIRQANEQSGSLKNEIALNEQLAKKNRELSAVVEELGTSNLHLHKTKESLEDLNSKLDALVKERTERILLLNQELEASNEEIRAYNEELTASNDKLFTINEKMEMLIEDLATSERKFRRLIHKAPVAINVFKGDDFIIESANERMLEIWNKTSLVEGKPFAEVLPEIADQPFINILHNVLKTGIPYHGHESMAIIVRNGIPEERHFDFIYQPIPDEDGRIGSILQVVTEVTEQVNARKEILEMNTRLNIAMEAGSLGSTEVDLETGSMLYNDQFRRMFGKRADEVFLYSDMFEAMLPQYREPIRNLVTIAKDNRSIYKGEYEIKWPDGSIHWISAHGRARYNSEGKPIKMVGILADITELKADEQRKNDFIGMVSHELKTPLTSLTGYVQILLSKARKSGDGFANNALEKADYQLKKMANMINSFLNVSRLESGKIHIESTSFDLVELIQEMKTEFMVTSSSHNIIFNPSLPIIVNADRDKIGHVVTNLISNAVKYSPAGTRITINCNIEGNNAITSVSDEGAGIGEEDKEKLFERYYRATNQPQTISGFGIGLYLCAEILSRHHGKIWVESLPGNGSTFYFSIPL